MSETIVKLEGAAIRQQRNTVLKDVNLNLKEGEFVYVVGRVGSGKTSLLKTLYAELPLEYGQGEVAGFPLKRLRRKQVALLRRKCGIVFQDFKLLTDRNVRANLEFVLRATGWKDKSSIRQRIAEVLAQVGLNGKEDKFPHQLSGGEQQRVVLARALLNAPPLILADEPTGNIDPETAMRLIELLKELSNKGKTVVIATHQYDLIKHFPGRVFRCEEGRLVEDHSFDGNHEQTPAPAPEAEAPTPGSEGNDEAAEEPSSPLDEPAETPGTPTAEKTGATATSSIGKIPTERLLALLKELSEGKWEDDETDDLEDIDDSPATDAPAEAASTTSPAKDEEEKPSDEKKEENKGLPEAFELI